MNNLLLKDTYIQQSRLANYCRTGEMLPIKGLTENRVNTYRRLVYNVIVYEKQGKNIGINQTKRENNLW